MKRARRLMPAAIAAAAVIAAAVRASANVAAHSLLVIVASVLDEPEGFAASEGVDAYFTKPVHTDELENMFRLVNDQPRAMRTGRQSNC